MPETTFRFVPCRKLVDRRPAVGKVIKVSCVFDRPKTPRQRVHSGRDTVSRTLTARQPPQIHGRHGRMLRTVFTTRP